MTETNAEPMLFIIYRPCGCLNFNPEEIERRYCGGCRKTHPNEGDWFLYEPSMGEEGMAKVFHAYLAVRDADKAARDADKAARQS